MIKPKEHITYLEKRYSKDSLSFPIEIPIGETEQLNVSWNIIDQSSSNYATLLQDFDIAEIVKSFVKRYKKSSNIAVLPKPGNLDLKDKVVNFHNFYAELEELKRQYDNDLSKASPSEIGILKGECEPIVEYILSGQHPNQSKQFSGWSSSFSRALKMKKNIILGIISIDLPAYVSYKKYKCTGTQHYVAFAYDAQLNKLILFDSASKNPSIDHSEVLYILKFVFDKLLGKEFILDSMVFRNVLQPGAGDQKEEDPKSYNNQNVFCHTWSLWFSLIIICFYNTPQHDTAMKFIRSLSHRNPLLNLVMIKRFAGWICVYLDENKEEREETAAKKFASKAYERAKERNDTKRLQETLEMYTLNLDPYVGLNYVYAYKNNKYVAIERVCISRKVKMDVDLLDQLDFIDINTYIEKSKQIRCPKGWALFEKTKRCRKIINSARV
jgi:hypothetical protein